MDYGDSNWTVGVLIGFLIFIAGIILFAIGICNKGKLNIALIGLMSIIIGALILIISAVNCENDNTKNINKVIKKEYTDAYIISKDKQFISDNKIYNYTIKDGKIMVCPLPDDINIKIIE
jgi:membrane-bound ClpP family serine protease